MFNGIDSLPAFRNPAVTVGSYDGVHKGHRVLLDVVRGKAKEIDGESVVVTFSPHPREVLDPDGVRLLNTLPEKIKLLESAGIDNLIVIPFDRDFSRMPYDGFIRDCLVGKVGMKVYVAGYNHHFGAGKQGGPDSMSELAAGLGFEYYRVPRWDAGDAKVSSTVVREHIVRGEMAAAAALLGYYYFIMGTFEDGCAVMVGSPVKLLPPVGVYDVAVSVGGRTFKGKAEVIADGGEGSDSQAGTLDPNMVCTTVGSPDITNPASRVNQVSQAAPSGIKLPAPLCSSIASVAAPGGPVTLEFL